MLHASSTGVPLLDIVGFYIRVLHSRQRVDIRASAALDGCAGLACPSLHRNGILCYALAHDLKCCDSTHCAYGLQGPPFYHRFGIMPSRFHAVETGSEVRVENALHALFNHHSALRTASLVVSTELLQSPALERSRAHAPSLASAGSDHVFMCCLNFVICLAACRRFR
eukprot:3226686-Pleurochrysis_carterae.AAC.1